MPNFETHYDSLQVSPKACEAVIRAAFRSLAQRYHPDKFDGTPVEAEQVMKSLNEAYAVLTDPELRRQHDQWIDSHKSGKEKYSENETASGFQRPKKEMTSASGSVESSSLVELVVKPARYMTVFGVLFGIVVFTYGIDAWISPIGGQGWTGSHLLIPNHYWQVFERFVAVPFGMGCIIWYGQMSMSSTLMIVSIDGILFSDDEGRIISWSEINQFGADDEEIKLSGFCDGKKWDKSFPKWLVAGECSEIIEKMLEYKRKSLSRTVWQRRGCTTS